MASDPSEGGLTMMAYLANLELAAFYVIDFVLAQALNRFKRDHPELDECAPAEAPELDSQGFVNVVAAAAIERYRGEASTSSSTADQFAQYNMNPMHFGAVICSVVGPLLSVLAVLLPHGFAWLNLSRSSVLRDVGVCVCTAMLAVYAARTYSILQLPEVTKSLWLSLMWFRIDFMLGVTAVSFVGFGALYISICLLVVSVYLALRLSQLERKLLHVQRDSQLLREEVFTDRVLAPGSEESKKASGIDDGYSQL